MTGSYHIKITVFMWSKLRPQYISYHNSYAGSVLNFWHFHAFPSRRILLLSSLSLPSMSAENPLFEWSLHQRQSSGLTTWRSYTQLAKNNGQKQSKICGFHMVSYAKLPTGSFSPQSRGHGVSWGEMDATYPSKKGICVMSEKTWKINALFFSKLDYNWILHVEFYDYNSTCRLPRLLIHSITVLAC